MLGGLVLMGAGQPAAGQRRHGADGLIQLTSNGYRAWLNRADIDWHILGLFTIGTIVTLAVLSMLAFQPNKVTVFLALGLMPYIAAALPKSLALDITKGAMPVFAGFVVVGTNRLAGMGGLCSMCFSSARADAPSSCCHKGRRPKPRPFVENHLLWRAGSAGFKR